MKATILITTFNRSNLLKFGLQSLCNQNFSQMEIEIVVLNDGKIDDTENICLSFKDKLNIKYFYTGEKSSDWRIPGYAINYGVKKTDSDFIFISCAEMYHLDNTVSEMLKILSINNKILTIPDIKDDNGSFLSKLQNEIVVSSDDYKSLDILHNIHLPFFMGMNRKDFIDIGGYDEDFIGIGYDDNDIVERMCSIGNKHYKVNCRLVHLWHERLNFSLEKTLSLYRYNESLFLNRRNKTVRNLDKNWGQL
jgi:glycosyltransferase involved in cell wall biosynthesis